MIKKTKILPWISMLLLCTMVFSMISFAEPTEEISATQTNEWLNKGWARLYKNQAFLPEKALTRGELTALINSLFDFKDQQDISFFDVASQSLYYKEVSKAFKAGYIVGRGDNTFAPEREVTRIEAYIMLARVLQLDINQQADQMLQFKDAKEVPSWGIGAVEALTKKGLINEKSKVKPFEKLLGSEAVTLLERIPVKTGETSNTNTAVQEEAKGGGKSALNFQGAFFVSIDNGKSVDLGNIEAGSSNKDIIIKLVFDRGVVRDNWDNNQKQIKLQSNNGSLIESEVFRIEGVDAEKSHIFIKPLSELKPGKTVNIVIGKDLKANNGNTLGKDEIITFSVK